jgi:hypothetical protein
MPAYPQSDLFLKRSGLVFIQHGSIAYYEEMDLSF